MKRTYYTINLHTNKGDVAIVSTEEDEYIPAIVAIQGMDGLTADPYTEEDLLVLEKTLKKRLKKVKDGKTIGVYSDEYTKLSDSPKAKAVWGIFGTPDEEFGLDYKSVHKLGAIYTKAEATTVLQALKQFNKGGE